MINIELNPAAVDEILVGLNTCYPGWGDRRTYEWAFERLVGTCGGDYMVLREDGEVVAGSALTYRNFETATGQCATMAIRSGSWTLPQARGRGHYTTLLHEGVALARAKGIGFVLSYVTASNASGRRARAAGAALFPTGYAVSTEDTPRVGRHLPYRATPADPRTLFEEFERRRAPVRVRYADESEWAAQFLYRPDPTVVLHVDGAGWAIVESHGEFERIQALAPVEPGQRTALITAVLARTQRAGRRLFFFDADAHRAERTTTMLGLSLIGGYMTLLPAHLDAAAELLKSEPDRSGMEASAAFGHWGIQTGDRM